MLGIDHLHGRQVADARSVCTEQLAPDRELAHSGPLEVVCTGLPLRSPTRELEVKKGFYGGVPSQSARPYIPHWAGHGRESSLRHRAFYEVHFCHKQALPVVSVYRALTHRQISWQSVSWLQGNAAYQPVKVSWLLGTLCTWEQACRACQMISPTESSLFSCSYIIYIILLLHGLGAAHYPSSHHGRLSALVSLNKPMSHTQPAGVFFGLPAFRAQILEQLKLSPNTVQPR